MTYLHCCREDITTATTRLKECIIDVGRWMPTNRLKLNTDKTELLWTGSRQHIWTPWSYTTGRRYCPSLRPCAVAWINYFSWSETRLPCVRRQFGVLLLATTASTSSPITQRQIGSHAGSRLCYIQGRLLQSAVGRSIGADFSKWLRGRDLSRRARWGMGKGCPLPIGGVVCAPSPENFWNFFWN